MRIFGSVARGKAYRESELDLGGLQMELESLLGRRADVVTLRGFKARIRERVLREAVLVRSSSMS